MGTCKDCKWWNSDGALREDSGTCHQVGSGDDVSSDVMFWLTDYGTEYFPNLFTRGDFGCVKFEILKAV